MTNFVRNVLQILMICFSCHVTMATYEIEVKADGTEKIVPNSAWLAAKDFIAGAAAQSNSISWPRDWGTVSPQKQEEPTTTDSQPEIGEEPENDDLTSTCPEGQSGIPPLCEVCDTPGTHCPDNTVNPVECPAGHYCPLRSSDAQCSCVIAGGLPGELSCGTMTEFGHGNWSCDSHTEACNVTGVEQIHAAQILGELDVDTMEGTGHQFQWDSYRVNVDMVVSSTIRGASAGIYANANIVTLPHKDVGISGYHFLLYSSLNAFTHFDSIWGSRLFLGISSLPWQIEGKPVNFEVEIYRSRPCLVRVEGIVMDVHFTCNSNHKKGSIAFLSTGADASFRRVQVSAMDCKVPCSKGTFNPDTGAMNSTQCIDCESQIVPVGSFLNCSQSGQTSAYSVCPIGLYCPGGIGSAATANVCPYIGFTTVSVGSGSVDDCIPCPAGMECVNVHRECPPGYYCLGGNSTAIACPIGTSSNAPGLTSLSGCTKCPPGTYGCNRVGATEAKQCPRGHYCQATNFTALQLKQDGGECSCNPSMDDCGGVLTQREGPMVSQHTGTDVTFYNQPGTVALNWFGEPGYKIPSPAWTCLDCCVTPSCQLSDYTVSIRILLYPYPYATLALDLGARLTNVSEGNKGTLIGYSLGFSPTTGYVQIQSSSSASYSSDTMIARTRIPEELWTRGNFVPYHRYIEMSISVVGDVITTTVNGWSLSTQDSDFISGSFGFRLNAAAPIAVDQLRVRSETPTPLLGCSEPSAIALPCPPGTQQPIEGQTTCLPCPPGTDGCGSFAVPGATQCPRGYACAGGTAERIPCPVGQYGNTTACIDCPIGSFGNTTALDQCLLCPPGSYTDETGKTKCRLCPAGTYSTEYGSATCHPCPIDTFAENVGTSKLSDCVPCPDRFYSSSGSSSCTRCEYIYEVGECESSGKRTISYTAINPECQARSPLQVSKVSNLACSYIPWNSSAGIVVVSASTFSSLCCILALGWIVTHWNNPLLKASLRIWTTVFVVACMLLNTVYLIHIGPPSSLTCAIKTPLVYTTATLAMSAMYVKISSVYGVFKQSIENCFLKPRHPYAQQIQIAKIMIGAIALPFIGLSVETPVAVERFVSYAMDERYCALPDCLPPTEMVCKVQVAGNVSSSTLTGDSEHFQDSTFSITSAAYLGVFVLLGLRMAWKARKLPADFSEAWLQTVTMCCICGTVVLLSALVSVLGLNDSCRTAATGIALSFVTATSSLILIAPKAARTRELGEKELKRRLVDELQRITMSGTSTGATGSSNNT